MSHGKVANEPAPIDLTFYEDQYLGIWSPKPARTYGDQVRVVSQVGGKTVQENLWEAANPRGKIGEDGLLSYEEARGKTFYVPISFCNNPGTIGFEVNSPSDFQNLRYILGTPIRLDRYSPVLCYQSPPENKAPDNFKISKEIYEDAMESLKAHQNTLSDELKDAIEENFGPLDSTSNDSFTDSLRTSAALFASAFTQKTAGAAMGFGVKAALMGVGISAPQTDSQPESQNECNWDLDEDLPDHCFEE